MAFRVLKAAGIDGLLRELNGMVVSKRGLTLRGKDQRPATDHAVAAAAGQDLFKHPVDGLTLIFTTPVATVTFSDNLTFKEIMAEIEAEVPGVGHLLKTDPNGGSVLALWDDTTPVTLSDTGTANEYFGFSTTAADPDLVQSPIPAANVYTIQTDPLSRQWVAVIDD